VRSKLPLIWKTTVEPAQLRLDTPLLPVVSILQATKASIPIRRRVFESAEVAVGRAVAERELWLPEDECVSRQHALLKFDPSALSATIEDLSRTGTFLQGVRVERASVQPGEVVRVGNSFFLYRFEPEPEAKQPTASAVDAELVGGSPALRAIRRTLGLVARSDATVLVLGESGTGKELAARTLHAQSGRAGPFIAVNCGAIPEALAESLLFGHQAGAFTGAKAEGVGWFRAAEGGTLFLDEIGELPLLLQPKLLRAVEERAVVPVGSTRAVSCDVRIVAATNKDLSDRRQFRADLLARISEFVVEIPPLSERREDILPIFWRLAGDSGAELHPELVAALLLQPYPHNVRDLRRIVRQLAVRGAGKAVWDVSLVDGLESSRTSQPPERDARSEPQLPAAKATPTRVPSREELEALLRLHGGNVAEIAREVGRSRKQVYRWLEQYELPIENYRRE
jgi:DNA-binding NtrC family response regulator